MKKFSADVKKQMIDSIADECAGGDVLLRRGKNGHIILSARKDGHQLFDLDLSMELLAGMEISLNGCDAGQLFRKNFTVTTT